MNAADLAERADLWEVDALPTQPIAKAKPKLSTLMTDALRHKPFLLDRYNGRDRAVVMSAEDMLALLEPFTFTPKVTVSDGEFTVRLPELNLIAAGPSYEDALTELAQLAAEHAENFFERLDFYMQTDRRSQLPWLLRLAVTPPSQWLGLLSPEPSKESLQVVQLA